MSEEPRSESREQLPLQSVPLYSEEQVKQIVAENLSKAMWNNPQVERLLKILEIYMGGVVHEKKLLAWAKPIIFIVILVAVGALKHNQAFDGEVALLIGTITGYFFGRNKSNE